MGSKKIIVPQGLINPNETTIIEIPHGVDSEATLIARSTPQADSPDGGGGSSSCGSPKCSRAKDKPKTAETRRSNEGGVAPRMITKVTSTTVFQTNEDGDEVMMARSNREDYSLPPQRSSYRSGQSYGYQDTTSRSPNTSRYQEKYPQQQYDYDSYQQSRSTNQCSQNQNLCDDTSCPAVSSIMEARNSRGMPQSATYAQQPSSYSYPNYPAQRQKVKITRKVITDSYANPPQPSSRRFNPGFNSTPNDAKEQSCTTCAPGRTDSQNLRSQVEKHLAEIEESERQKINRDLAIFQQARRRLVEDATNISSGESNIQFKKGKGGY